MAAAKNTHCMLYFSAASNSKSGSRYPVAYLLFLRTINWDRVDNSTTVNLDLRSLQNTNRRYTLPNRSWLDEQSTRNCLEPTDFSDAATTYLLTDYTYCRSCIWQLTHCKIEYTARYHSSARVTIKTSDNIRTYYQCKSRVFYSQILKK